MNTLDEFLDAAKANIGTDSDRKLSVAIGLKTASVCSFRQKRSLPSDATMVRLSELAGVDPQRGLLQLNMWRASSTHVAEQYSRILQRIAGVFAIFTLVIVGSSSVQASNNYGTDSHKSFLVYKLCDLWTREFLRWLRSLWLFSAPQLRAKTA